MEPASIMSYSTAFRIWSGFVPFVAVLFFSGMAGCRQAQPTGFSGLRERIRGEFPAFPAEIPLPLNNPQTPIKIELGEALFFDPNLSSCGDIACATCHIPEMGFSDGLRVSNGCAGAIGRRNSNGLYGTAVLSHLFWDGRAQSLEEQALGPVVDPAEMANTWDNVVAYLSTGVHPVTRAAFPQAATFYKTRFDTAFAGEISSATVAKAVAAYERTLISRDSAFDRWLGGDDDALTPAQLRGAAIFFGRAQCSHCHKPPFFTDSDFHNVGVPQAGFEKAGLFPLNEKISGGIPPDVDPGRAEVSFLHDSRLELGKFKTPSLRNVVLSAPYMHNGRFRTLEDTVQHYWNAGRGTAQPVVGELDPKVRFIRLTDSGGHPDDITNLVEFLKALTGSQASSPSTGITPPREP